MDLLREAAKGLGLTLSAKHLAAFDLYYRELDAWNQRFNLTAITGYEDVQRKLFLDSLSCILALPQAGGARPIPDVVPLQLDARPLWCLDVGSGAGFPGIPLKLMLPDAKMTLIEATGKKAGFLRHMVETLGLGNIEVVNARAEDAGRLPEHREQYDWVLARAVSSLQVLAEYCLPFCRVGGRMVAQKGSDVAEEVAAAQNALETLGGVLVEIKPVTLPELRAGNHLVVIDKVRKTPDEYPRRPGIPTKKPL